MRLSVLLTVFSVVLVSGCASAGRRSSPRLPASDYQTEQMVDPLVSGESLEAFLVAASRVSQLTADSFEQQQSIKLSRVNYLLRLARTVKNVYVLHSDGFDRRAGEIGPEKTLDLTAALNSLNSASASLIAAKGGNSTELKTIFNHSSDMNIQSAQLKLIQLLDQHIIQVLQTQGEDAAYQLKDLREILHDDLI